MKKSALKFVLGGCLVWAAVGSVGLKAQQNVQITQYMLNTLSYNPGFAGLSNGLCASALYRQQWGNIYDGSGENKTRVSPWDVLVLVDAPVKVLKGALSMEILSDNIGYFSDITVKLGYAYHLQTSFGKIGLGVQGVLLNKKAKYSDFKPENAADPVLSGKGDESAFFGDVSVGAYLQGSRDYFVGVSVSNIIPQRNEDMGYRLQGPLLSVNGGYNFGFPSLPKVQFTATGFLQTDFKAVDWSLSALATFNRLVWTGLSFRMDAVSVLAGINIMKIRIGLAYDIATTRLIKASAMGGSLEVFVKYCFNLDVDKVNTEYKHARYL